MTHADDQNHTGNIIIVKYKIQLNKKSSCKMHKDLVRIECLEVSLRAEKEELIYLCTGRFDHKSNVITYRKSGTICDGTE